MWTLRHNENIVFPRTNEQIHLIYLCQMRVYGKDVVMFFVSLGLLCRGIMNEIRLCARQQQVPCFTGDRRGKKVTLIRITKKNGRLRRVGISGSGSSNTGVGTPEKMCRQTYYIRLLLLLLLLQTGINYNMRLNIKNYARGCVIITVSHRFDFKNRNDGGSGRGYKSKKKKGFKVKREKLHTVYNIHAI